MTAFDLLPDAIPLRLDGMEFTDAGVVVNVTSQQTGATCPDCGHAASRVHSRYSRSLADLPWGRRRVRLNVRVRRFFCDAPGCPRRTFAERLAGLAARYARRSAPLAAVQRQLGLALGGEAGARLAAPLAMPVSADTLLRLIRRMPAPGAPPPRVLGVDDWAFRKGHRYGTLLVDLERGRPVELLADREPRTLVDWLRRHPQVEVIARDRAQVYIDAATEGAPQARQVADRFHLLTNLREALERFLDGHPTELRQVKLTREPAPAEAGGEHPAEIPANLPHLKRRPLTAHSRTLARRAGRRAQHQARFDEVHALARQGHSQRHIARTLKLARPTVRRWLAASEPPRRSPPTRASTVGPWGDYLRTRWHAGCHSPRQLWHEIRAQGYAGSEPAVWRWLLHVREAEAAGKPVLDVRPRTPPQARTYALNARQAAWLLVRPPEALKPEEATWLTQMQAAWPPLATGQALAQQFVAMAKAKQADGLDDWLRAAEASGVPELASFAVGLRGDYRAVQAALSLPWSNGPTEGHITRLKLIKRTMYGRANFDLLRQRVLYAH